MTIRRGLSLLCLLICASALVGCAGGDALALDPVAQAASTTATTTSSRFEYRASLTTPSVGSFSFQGNGTYDGKHKSGWMNMHFALPPAYQLQLPSSDPTMEMIFDGSHGLVMYMRSALFDKLVPVGKWVKMDVGKMAEQKGVDLGGIMSANRADPSQSLRILMASSGNARVTGSERIRGVQTTHYAFDIDFEKLARGNEAFKNLTEAAGSVSAPAEAWIDAKGRVRRLAVSMSMGAKLGTPMTLTMTEDLYDFGVQVNVTPPSGDAVVDLAALTGSSS
jgi:hypothetical protein